jgi:hypothetical protein
MQATARPRSPASAHAGKAYLLRCCRPPEVYFKPEEIKAIEAWIEAEEAAPENPMRVDSRKKMKRRSAR